MGKNPFPASLPSERVKGVFRFRFEQVLNVRKLAEDQALQEFSEQVRGLELEKERRYSQELLRIIAGLEEENKRLREDGRI